MIQTNMISNRKSMNIALLSADITLPPNINFSPWTANFHCETWMFIVNSWKFMEQWNVTNSWQYFDGNSEPVHRNHSNFFSSEQRHFVIMTATLWWSQVEEKNVGSLGGRARNSWTFVEISRKFGKNSRTLSELWPTLREILTFAKTRNFMRKNGYDEERK